MVFVIAVAAIMLPILFGLGIGAALSQFDHVIEVTKDEIANKDQGFNPGLTLGYQIKTTKEADEQVKDARKLAAKIAASQPRGANMRIGNVYQPNLKTAWEGVDEDPLTAARIAEFHGWEGVKTGAAGDDGAAAAEATDAPVVKIKVIPGKDYTAIPITASMSLDEKRKARIANVRVNWVQADMLHFHPARQYSFVFDRGCFHCAHREDPSEALGILTSVTQTGGRVLLLTGNANEKRDHGPPTITEEKLRSLLDGPFRIDQLREFYFEDAGEVQGPLGWSCLMTRM